MPQNALQLLQKTIPAQKGAGMDGFSEWKTSMFSVDSGFRNQFLWSSAAFLILLSASAGAGIVQADFWAFSAVG